LFVFSNSYRAFGKPWKRLFDATGRQHIAGTRRRQIMRKYILAAIAAFSARFARAKKNRNKELSWA
jgi:hypothetical protein